MEMPCFVLEPLAAHSHTVVFLHGRGSTARRFADALALWQDSQGRTLMEVFESFRWVFPQAPMCKSARLASDVIPQWFDVWDVRNFSDREELQSDGLCESVAAIRRILADEAALLSGRWKRLVLAGISQGAATGFHTLFNLDMTPEAGGGLAAFMGFSARCPFADRHLTKMRKALHLEGAPDHDGVLRSTPMLLEHCLDDALVLIENGRRARELLRSFGAHVVWKEYPDGGHWLNSPSGIDDAVDFLQAYVVA